MSIKIEDIDILIEESINMYKQELTLKLLSLKDKLEDKYPLTGKDVRFTLQCVIELINSVDEKD